jgi:hypothetical protein
MRFERFFACTFAGALLLGGITHAEPIQVEYLVGQKAFKKGATAADPLSFELFSDEACTTSIGTADHFVGDEAIHYFVDKRQKVKDGAKLPKVVRILATIDGPTTTTAPYLMVTGPGVSPVGDACQLQPGDAVAGAGPTGPQCAEGPQGLQGDPGPQGPQGDPGPAGADGAQGPQGDPGPAGADGAQGEPGPAGAEGAQGPQGDPGPAGAAGAQGPQGDPGPAGADGAQGPQGDPGPAGADGADGTSALVVEAEVTAAARSSPRSRNTSAPRLRL